MFGLLRYRGESRPGRGVGGQGLHLVSWCCQSVPRWRGLAPVVHGVGRDGHGRGHRDGRAAHGELAVDRVVGTGAAAAAALGAGGPCGVGAGTERPAPPPRPPRPAAEAERERAGERAGGWPGGPHTHTRGTPLPPPAVTLDNPRAHYGAHPGVGVIDNPRVGCAARGREEGRETASPPPARPGPHSRHWGVGRVGTAAAERGREERNRGPPPGAPGRGKGDVETPRRRKPERADVPGRRPSLPPDPGGHSPKGIRLLWPTLEPPAITLLRS